MDSVLYMIFPLQEHPLEVLNLDCWDVILASYFCDCYNIHIDYENKVIHIGDITNNNLVKR
jgi:hypothetical protein